MKFATLRVICFIMATLLPSILHAEVSRFGSIYYFDELPKTAFLLGPVEQNDSFELRRLIRNNEVDFIVTASPGGNLFEGLQMASIIHDNGLETYLPSDWSCESSCVNIFLGGKSRLVSGQLGVHQFYSPDGDTQRTTQSSATKTALYTTSDIIGILNQFETPPFVYERMFSTTDIYYFSDSEKRRLNVASNKYKYFDRIDKIDYFMQRNGNVMRKIHRYDMQETETTAVREAEPEAEPAPKTKTSSTDDSIIENVDFFGNDLSKTGYRNVSIGECDKICRNNPNCAAWSYVHSSRWCWPKSRVTNISVSNNITSSVIDSSRVDQTIFERPFLEISGQDIVGFDLFSKGIRNTSLSQCRATCEAEQACEGFSWVSKQNWCWPKYRVGKLVKRNGIISGVPLHD